MNKNQVIKYKIKPYYFPAIVIFLNSIILQVSVPVLSEKICLICPISSFKLEDYTLVAIFVDFCIISGSLEIMMPYINFTISKDTNNDMGI